MTLKQKKDLLYDSVFNFINKLDINCAETIYQTDKVIESAHEFIENCCDIVGYKNVDEEN